MRSLLIASILFLSSVCNAAVTSVIHISIDGFRGDAVSSLPESELPNFYRLRREGAFTDNARTDFDYSITLPNHTSQLTSRAVVGPNGHNWVTNVDPLPNETLHSNKGAYVASIFDVAHDNGLRTGCFASKTKFSLYDQSYDATHGGVDVTGTNQGRDKIDIYQYRPDTTALTECMLTNGACASFGYTFLHLRDPDTAGHTFSWNVTDPQSPYMQAVRQADACIGLILADLDADPSRKATTTLILTADHGGISGTFDHSDATSTEAYTIPFYMWGADVAHEDLYTRFAGTRFDPGTARIDYANLLQPIRNGDAANIAAGLLGIGQVPGSTINVGLIAVVPEPGLVSFSAAILVALPPSRHVRRRAA